MVSKAGSGRGAKSTTPDNQQPNTTPLEAAGQHSFVLQGVMELQRSFGSFEKSIQALETKVSEQSKKVEGLQRVVWISTGAIIVLGAIGGIILRANYERIAELLSPPVVAESTVLPAAVSQPVPDKID